MKFQFHIAVLAAIAPALLPGCRRPPPIANEKLAKNEEYVRLSREAWEARGKMLSFGSKPNSTPDEVKEYKALSAKCVAMANRMKQIEFELVPESRWHAQAGWKAEDYFQDAQVVALCRAIENDDVAEMERLIATGANANAIGKAGMTPLLWAFPDRRIERFACLLRHGANPNVFIESDFGLEHRAFHPFPIAGSSFLDRGCHPGQTVVHLASRSPMIEYLQLVVAHGANVNIIDKKTGETPLNLVVDSWIHDDDERVALLMAHGADLNHYCAYRRTYPVMAAVQQSNYQLALTMLEGGADPHLYQTDGERKLIHVVLAQKRLLPEISPQLVKDYESLVTWLAKHGETLEQAQADEQRWAELYKNAFSPAQRGKVRQQIVDQRNAEQDKN